MNSFRPAVRDVHQNHRGVDEGVVFVELSSERSGFVPVGVVAERDCSASRDAPGLFVELLDARRLLADKGLESLDVAREVTDLIKGVPSGDLYGHGAGDVRDVHDDVENVLLRVIERDLIANRSSGGRREAEQEQKQKEFSLRELGPSAE